MQKSWTLIRGIVSEEYHWWNFVPQLKKCFPNDHICTADIIGNGKTHHKKTPWGVQANINALRGQVENKNRKILIGFSLGGMLSVEWAYRHPEEIKAIVLINVSLNHSAFYKRMRTSSALRIIRSSFIKDSVKRESQILKMTTRKISNSEINLIAQDWGSRNVLHPIHPTNFLIQMILANLCRQKKSPPPVPILILCSAKDLVVNPDCSKKISKIWNLPLVTHPDAGHDLTLDDPEWVLQQISEWMQKVNI